MIYIEHEDDQVSHVEVLGVVSILKLDYDMRFTARSIRKIYDFHIDLNGLNFRQQDMRIEGCRLSVYTLLIEKMRNGSVVESQEFVVGVNGHDAKSAFEFIKSYKTKYPDGEVAYEYMHSILTNGYYRTNNVHITFPDEYQWTKRQQQVIGSTIYRRDLLARLTRKISYDDIIIKRYVESSLPKSVLKSASISKGTSITI